MKNKLLYIHNNPPTNNKANTIQVANMANALANNFDKVCLALPNYKNNTIDDYKKNILSKINDKLKFEIILYESNAFFINRTKLFEPFFSVVELLKDNINKYEYIITRNLITSHLAIKLGYSVIYESHNNLLSDNRFLNYFLTQLLVKNSKNNNQKLFIAISKSLSEYWISKGVEKSKVIVLHDGVSENILNEKISLEEARIECNLDINKKYVVYTGNLDKNRGIDSIIKLAQDIKSATFLVVGGDSSQLDYYNKLINNTLDNIHFIGHVPHSKIKYYLASADVLLMIWSWEIRTMKYCSPLKLFEYMASGRIIVGHGFPTIKEVLQDKIDSFLVDPNSYYSLRKALLNALALNTPNKFSEKLLLKTKKYTWENRASLIAERLFDD